MFLGVVSIRSAVRCSSPHHLSHAHTCCCESRSCETNLVTPSGPGSLAGWRQRSSLSANTGWLRRLNLRAGLWGSSPELQFVHQGRLGFLWFINRSRRSEVPVFIRGGISAGCRRDYLAHRGGQLWAFNPGMSGIASAAGIKTQLTPDGQSHVAVSLQASAQARLRGLRCSITPQSRTQRPVISLLPLSQ